MKIAGIYLAGGHSRRMRTTLPKLALPVGSKTLGSLALETILSSSLKSIFVIVQEHDDVTWLPSSMKNHVKCTIIHCPNAHLGQAETLRCGIYQAIKEEMDAVIIFLADQPNLPVEMIHHMLQYTKQSPTSKFIALTFNEIIYPPVLFKKELFDSLLKIEGDQGAKALLKEDFLKMGTLLPLHSEKSILDVDTKEQFQQFKKEMSRKSI